MTEKLSAFDLETFISKLVDALPKFVGAAIIIALGFWVSALIGKLLIKGLERKGVDASIHSFLRSIVVWVLRFAVILSALSTLGFNLNSFIAALGAAGRMERMLERLARVQELLGAIAGQDIPTEARALTDEAARQIQRIQQEEEDAHGL